MGFLDDLAGGLKKTAIDTAAGSSNPYLKSVGGLLGGGGGSGGVAVAMPPPPPPKSAPAAPVGKVGKGFGKGALVAIGASAVALFIALRK